MRIGSLQIEQTWARIGMERQRGGGVEMRQRSAELQIQQASAQLEITPNFAKVTIDQSAAWADVGLAGNVDFMATQVQEARAAALEGIGRVAQAGDLMMRQRNAIPTIVERACWREYEFNFDMVPKHPPKVDVVDAEPPQIEITPSETQIDVQPHSPEITFRPDALRIYLEQREALSIRYQPALDARV